MVAIELLLMKEFSFPPAVGIVAGAIASFPLSYFFSIHFIWEINPSSSIGKLSRISEGISIAKKVA